MVTGSTASGKTFDSRSVEFEIGEGLDQNIPVGVEQAIEKMKKGEEAEVIIKPEYGFGVNGFQNQAFPGYL